MFMLNAKLKLKLRSADGICQQQSQLNHNKEGGEEGTIKSFIIFGKKYNKKQNK